MSSIEQASSVARQLLLQGKSGVLSTISVDVPGYPFGSVVPYCLDREQNPYIYISDIAQHTRNIDRDKKVSLTIQANAVDDVQAAARLTLLADAEKITPADAGLEERYARYFPSSSGYRQAHGFYFYRLGVFRGRYIGGFGEVYWLDRENFLLPNPLSLAEEKKVVAHINEHHGPLLNTCVEKTIPAAAENNREAVMVGMDAEGFDLLCGSDHFRCSFPQPVRNIDEAREAFIALNLV